MKGNCYKLVFSHLKFFYGSLTTMKKVFQEEWVVWFLDDSLDDLLSFSAV